MKRPCETPCQTAQQLQEILDSLPEGILTIDDGGRIIGINRSACETLGVSREKALQKGCTCVLGEKLCGPDSILLDSIRKRQLLQSYETHVLDPSGKRRVLSLTGTILRNAEGNDVGGVISFRDITELSSLKQDLAQRYSLHNIVGKSKPMQEIFHIIQEVADSNATVLIEGESGTGKELVARAIHYHHVARSKKPFVAVNCSALAEGLLESELFGHVRGAFTGAIRDKQGRFEAADGGTVFLDEIGDISPFIQVKLLRFLQERTFERVGSDKSTTVDVRVVAATHKSLSNLVEQGKFRHDLYYRLRVVPVRLPALRERRDDIPLLAQHFVDRFRSQTGRPIEALDPDSLETVVDYDWPGNVRELENAIEYAFVKCREGLIGKAHLPVELRATGNTRYTLDASQSQPMKLQHQSTADVTRNTLDETGWNVAKAARKLSISRTTLYKRIRELNLQPPA